MAGEVREALKGAEDAPGVVKLQVPGKTAGKLRAAAGLLALVLVVLLGTRRRLDRNREEGGL